MKVLWRIIVILLISIICALSACNAQKTAVKDEMFSGTLRIARQYSMMYAPVYVMEKKGILEKYLPGMTIEWAEIGTSAAIFEAMAANRLDVAFGGAPPAIIGWDKGIKLKILSNLYNGPMGLQANGLIKNLPDFTSGDKIAMPNLGSIQHIILSMACENEFGDAHALDNNIVVLSHPDGATALINGSVSAHFTALPYLAKENEAGLSTILTGVEAFGGDYSTIVSFATKKFHDENPTSLACIVAALNEAMYLINTRDHDVLTIIAETENISIEETRRFLDWEGTNYTTTLYGIEGFIDFMLREDYISKKPALSELLWEGAYSTIGRRSGTLGILENAQKRGEK
jgi:NitT/TauT family transport system substrate-binding protein